MVESVVKSVVESVVNLCCKFGDKIPDEMMLLRKCVTNVASTVLFDYLHGPSCSCFTSFETPALHAQRK